MQGIMVMIIYFGIIYSGPLVFLLFPYFSLTYAASRKRFAVKASIDSQGIGKKMEAILSFHGFK